MSRSRAAPGPRGLLVLLMAYAVLAAAVVLAPLTWGSASARATEQDLLHLQVDRVSPAIAGPGTEVRLEGTLRNLGSTPAAVHAIRVSTAYRGLDTRGAVQEWAEAGLLETPVLLGEDHIGIAVAPGSTVHWFVDVPADQFDPGFEFATLPLRLEVVASGTGDEVRSDPVTAGDDVEDAPSDATEVAGAPVPGAEVRTYLPWTSAQDADFNPVRLGWLAPLTLPGDAGLVDPDDEVRAGAWAAAIGPESRTQALLDGLAGTEATFLVDPALLEPLDPVASLTEVVELPGEQESPTESPEEPDPTEPQETPAPTQTPGAPSGEAPLPSPGDAPTSRPGGDVTQAPPTDEATATSAPGDRLDPAARTATATAPGTTEGPGATDEPDLPGEPVVPPTPPTTEGAVADLAARIEELPEGRLWWLPVGDTDAGALLDIGAEPGEIADLVGRAPAAGLPAPGRTDVAWPLSEEFTDATIESLRQVWATSGGATGAAGPGNGSLGGVVLPGQVLEDSVLTGSAVRTHATGPQLIGYDERLTGIVAASGEEGQHGHATQRFLAETLAIYQEGPATDRSLAVAIPRTVEVDPGTLQTLTEAASDAPWLQDSTISELMTDAATAPPSIVQPAPAPPGGAPDSGPDQGAEDEGQDSGADQGAEDGATEGEVPAAALGDLTAYSIPGASPLTASRLNRIDLTRTRVEGVSEIVPGTEHARRTWMRVLDRQFSAGWRAAPTEWATPLEVAEQLASEILNGLTINPTTINLYADEGLMQITVVNDLPIPVEGLRMQVDPGNARLRVLEQPEPITIGPGSRATVQFRAKAVAAGQVPLHTSLSTPNGTQVGSAEETVVRVQPTGVWIYWLLGGVAGVILVLGLWRALRPAGTRREAAGTTDQSEQNVAAPGPDAETP